MCQFIFSGLVGTSNLYSPTIRFDETPPENIRFGYLKIQFPLDLPIRRSADKINDWSIGCASGLPESFKMYKAETSKAATNAASKR
jgi:hypothetical protein